MLELPQLKNYTSVGDHGRPYSYEDDISDVDDIEVMEKWYKNQVFSPFILWNVYKYNLYHIYVK